MCPECVFLRVRAPEGQETHHLEGSDEGSCHSGKVLHAHFQGELRLCFRGRYLGSTVQHLEIQLVHAHGSPG